MRIAVSNVDDAVDIGSPATTDTVQRHDDHLIRPKVRMRQEILMTKQPLTLEIQGQDGRGGVGNRDQRLKIAHRLAPEHWSAAISVKKGAERVPVGNAGINPELHIRKLDFEHVQSMAIVSTPAYSV